MAFDVARRVLGVTVEHYDTAGRQGAVDAILHYPDGRTAAFEVTRLAGPGELQLDSILGRQGHSWPNPGNWWWTINVDSVADIPRLRSCYASILQTCESLGVQRPDSLGWTDHARDDEDLQWLAESSVRMVGHPEVPSRTDDKVRDVMVVRGAVGGAVDEALSGLPDALHRAFEADHVRRRIGKLGRAAQTERHLFLILGLTGLAFPVIDGLIVGRALPSEPPPVPTDTVTHLWLAPAWSQRVLLWANNSWSQWHPYDAA